jgi:hypothetical protein
MLTLEEVLVKECLVLLNQVLSYALKVLGIEQTQVLLVGAVLVNQ